MCHVPLPGAGGLFCTTRQLCVRENPIACLRLTFAAKRENATLWMLCLLHENIVITENKSILQNLKVPLKVKGEADASHPAAGHDFSSAICLPHSNPPFSHPHPTHFLFLKRWWHQGGRTVPWRGWLVSLWPPVLNQVAAPTEPKSAGRLTPQELPHTCISVCR